jgi:ABC-type amino acid transport substrate-binding protein
LSFGTQAKRLADLRCNEVQIRTSLPLGNPDFHIAKQTMSIRKSLLDVPHVPRLRKRRLLLVTMACAGWASQAFPADASSSTRLVLLIADQAAPKMFIEDGKPIGYMTELAAEALRRAGYDVEIQAYLWARSVVYAQAGMGVITSLSHTPERDKLFLFSHPIYEDKVLMITRRGAGLRLNGLHDLAGRRVGFQQGASFGPEFEAALPTFEAERDVNASNRLRKLLAGRLDVAILSGGPPAVRYYAMRASIQPDDLEVQKSPLVVDTNHIAIARSRPDAQEVIQRVNGALAAMRSDGSSARIIGRYE